MNKGNKTLNNLITFLQLWYKELILLSFLIISTFLIIFFIGLSYGLKDPDYHDYKEDELVIPNRDYKIDKESTKNENINDIDEEEVTLVEREPVLELEEYIKLNELKRSSQNNKPIYMTTYVSKDDGNTTLILSGGIEKSIDTKYGSIIYNNLSVSGENYLYTITLKDREPSMQGYINHGYGETVDIIVFNDIAIDVDKYIEGEIFRKVYILDEYRFAYIKNTDTEEQFDSNLAIFDVRTMKEIIYVNYRKEIQDEYGVYIVGVIDSNRIVLHSNSAFHVNPNNTYIYNFSNRAYNKLKISYDNNYTFNHQVSADGKFISYSSGEYTGEGNEFNECFRIYTISSDTVRDVKCIPSTYDIGGYIISVGFLSKIMPDNQNIIFYKGSKYFLYNSNSKVLRELNFDKEGIYEFLSYSDSVLIFTDIESGFLYKLDVLKDEINDFTNSKDQDENTLIYHGVI